MGARRVLFLALLFLGGFERSNAGDSGKPDDLFKQIHSATEQKGVSFTAEYTGEVFRNLVGGFKRGSTYAGLIRASLKLDLAKLLC
jgi:carbohydrate-selective porin OprB